MRFPRLVVVFLLHSSSCLRIVCVCVCVALNLSCVFLVLRLLNWEQGMISFFFGAREGPWVM